MRSIPLIIIGAGASGMAAAWEAAGTGCETLVLEHNKKCGRKLTATGNGRCNFTNARQEPSCYRSDTPGLAWEILQRFPQEKTLSWMHEIGITPWQREGYYYPASGNASAVVHALEQGIRSRGVTISLEEELIELVPEKGGWRVVTDREQYLARNVILAMGGKASPVHGTHGEVYHLLQQFGCRIITPLPALTSLELKGDFMKGWTGVRTRGRVTMVQGKDRILSQDEGELQMVAHGISGIPVFQVSRFAARALEQGEKVSLYLDILPWMELPELEEELAYRACHLAGRSLEQALEGLVHNKLARVCARMAGLDPDGAVDALTPARRKQLASRMKSWKLGVSGISGFDKAQVTSGGLALDEVNPETMEIRRVPGIYAVGETLDVDGICGGYNLQWAWTTGILAGKAAARNRGRGTDR